MVDFRETVNWYSHSKKMIYPLTPKFLSGSIYQRNSCTASQRICLKSLIAVWFVVLGLRGNLSVHLQGNNKTQWMQWWLQSVCLGKKIVHLKVVKVLNIVMYILLQFKKYF